MIAILPLLLAIPQMGAGQVYDHNGNVPGIAPGSTAPGDLLNQYTAGANPNSGAARNGGTLLLTSGYDGAAVIYQVDEATGASTGTVAINDSGDFGLAYDGVRGLYVTTHAGTDIVSTFNATGLVNSWPAPGSGPVGAAHDTLRDVYWICDWSGNTLTAMDPTSGLPGTTFDLAAVGCTRSAGVAYDAANDQVIVGGRDASAIFVLDAATGALVRSFGAQDGSNNCQGLADSSSGNVWHTSWNSGDVFEVDLGNAGGGLTLAVSGTCPGLMSIDISGATPNDQVMLVYGSAGSFTVPGGPCAGLVLGIASPTLGAALPTDASGNASLSPTVGAGCGLTLQAVDLNACAASNTDTL